MSIIDTLIMIVIYLKFLIKFIAYTEKYKLIIELKMKETEFEVQINKKT